VTSEVKVVTTRDLTRNVTGMRGLSTRDIYARVFPSRRRMAGSRAARP
jgi:hypothetical protein